MSKAQNSPVWETEEAEKRARGYVCLCLRRILKKGRDRTVRRRKREWWSFPFSSAGGLGDRWNHLRNAFSRKDAEKRHSKKKKSRTPLSLEEVLKDAPFSPSFHDCSSSSSRLRHLRKNRPSDHRSQTSSQPTNQNHRPITVSPKSQRSNSISSLSSAFQD